ncbi:hypothetical protein [Flavobacterium pectinovorum]|uniref:hypothetical protein n=1 Tax=Flavobacterium pectinovorum TaxID=29533 RepID=UPI001FAE4FDF|nr:hypothetical protein [Flavobacterium pectinovorum]MCI9843883.1 hypothetical protein [Flavobacterium pectinovorum]
MSKKIGIIFWDGWLGVAPTLISIIEYFAEKNNEVFVYLRDDDEFDLSIIETFDQEKVTVCRIPSKGNFLQKKMIHTFARILVKVKNWHLISVERCDQILYNLEQLKSYLDISNFSKQIQKKQEKSFDLTFCVDTLGLFVHKKSRMKSEKIINLSLELLYDLKGNKEWLNKLIKKNEREYLKSKVLFTLIQDTFRWQAYKKINNIEHDRFLLLPNSTRKSSVNDKIQKSDFFYKKFNLDSETTIVLSAGMICDEVCSYEIAQAAGDYNFKSKTKIIFHNRIKNDRIGQSYLENVRVAGKDNLCLSLDPVAFSELHKIFNSAHIGLVIYKTDNIDENFNSIGAASGKLYQYIKYGLPIIVSKLEGLEKIVEDHNIGITVNSPIEIPIAIEKIITNYQYYSNNARMAFEKKLNIDFFLDDIYKKI